MSARCARRLDAQNELTVLESATHSRPVSDSAACAGMSAYLTIACKISSDWGEVARGRSHSFTMLQTPLSKMNE